MNESSSRRTVLKTLALSAVGTVVFSESGCKTSNVKRGAAVGKPLKPVYTAPKTKQLAIDGKDWGWNFKMRSFQTNGQFSCMEVVLPAKTLGVEPHYHKKLDEILHVLEGTVHVMVGDDVFEVKAGGWHMRPHGIVHAFWNAGDVPVRFIDMFLNQDFDVCLEELVQVGAKIREKNISPASEEAKEMIKRISDKYEIYSREDLTPAILDKYSLKRSRS